jgi:hypothetical protein
VSSCAVVPRPSFLDFITGGCELNFMVAIDFTGSNGDPKVRCGQGVDGRTPAGAHVRMLIHTCIHRRARSHTHTHTHRLTLHTHTP